MIVSLDTETTGVDLRHGARPFFVTTCNERGEWTYWEWAVDPLTREPFVPEGDLDDVAALVEEADTLVLQNAKFDFAALQSLWTASEWEFPWGKVQDTLLAGHLLASNRPHDLTAMAVQYLGVDIQPYEDALRTACDEARRYCRTHFPDWNIAKAGMEGMPSAKEKCWKFDTWLPRALVTECGGADALSERMGKDVRHWDTVLREYANADSAVTVSLWKAQERLIRERGLWNIYEFRRKLLPIVYGMEARGVTVSKARIDKLKAECWQESEETGAACVRIAAERGVPLSLPKSGSNKSLLAFVEAVLDGEGVEKSRIKQWTDGGGLSLDKGSSELYQNHFRDKYGEECWQYEFFDNLRGKRRRDTALTYLAGYERFWRGVGGVDGDTRLLHPSLNMTGTSTLRFSSSNPNEQNISKQTEKCRYCRGKGGDCKKCGGKGERSLSLRYGFGPGPGREWWSLDAKNIELRLPAYECGEPEMIALFEEPDAPPFYGSNHMLIFSILWPAEWEAAVREVGIDKAAGYCKKKYASTQYQWTKNGDFAVQYGAVNKADGTGTADRAYHQKGAQTKVDARFTKLTALNRQWIAFANRHGYVETMPDREVDPSRGYPLLCTRTERGNILETVPLNYHIQGTAMWWTCKAMVRCEEQMAEWNRRAGKLTYWIAMQVHDEIVFDFPKRADPRTDPKRSNLGRIRMLQKLMERGGVDLNVPTPVGVEYNPETWSEGIAV